MCRFHTMANMCYIYIYVWRGRVFVYIFEISIDIIIYKDIIWTALWLQSSVDNLQYNKVQSCDLSISASTGPPPPPPFVHNVPQQLGRRVLSLTFRAFSPGSPVNWDMGKFARSSTSVLPASSKSGHFLGKTASDVGGKAQNGAHDQKTNIKYK